MVLIDSNGLGMKISAVGMVVGSCSWSDAVYFLFLFSLNEIFGGRGSWS